MQTPQCLDPELPSKVILHITFTIKSGYRELWLPHVGHLGLGVADPLSKTMPTGIRAQQIGIVMDTFIISKIISWLYRWWCNWSTQHRNGLGQLINAFARK
jgi:hypothetical protein